MGNGSLFLADLKLADVLFSVEFDFWLVVDVLQAMKRAVVQVILTWEEWIPPIPNELLDSVDILQQKETELCRLTGMPTETF
ncbi:hypothetical protein F2Q68_00044441 [Brassica cretica]|uniref:Uncharacterized protein n=1 Tax=Brassica cretica TaxID=69181 RepID=A0A8S9LLB5_BRACR|nr:hypothetical protein F2Q68_00044441 [Brassica cretica]